MKDIKDIKYHKTSESLVDVVCQKTETTDRIFFRVLVAYYFCKVASSMRTEIKTHDRGTIPVNLYGINLAPSGLGKGYSTNIMEEEVIERFRERFVQETFPTITETSLARLASKRAAKNNTDPEIELAIVTGEFIQAGQLVFSFSEATSAAVKQMRHKLLMANAGAVNFEMDEIGSNLLGNREVLDAFFELYDVGKIKQKLIKNTRESIRAEEIIGKTPTNMMLFGTQFKLLDGGRVEEEMMSMFETGMARRCFFGICDDPKKTSGLTPTEIYDKLTDPSANTFLTALSLQLEALADPVNFNVTLEMSKDVSLLIIEYKSKCELYAASLGVHENMRKAEISHRYFKMQKLAGAYAFIDGVPDITEEHVYNAIKLAEDSGEAFRKLLKRDRNYVKLAKYIATSERDLTSVDLVEDLPYYKGSAIQKKDMMDLAIAWGYSNNIIIKKSFKDGIDFLKGESLEETNLTKIKCSFSGDMAHNYKNKEVPFTQLHAMTQLSNYHWVAHHLQDGHRCEDKIIQGFNLVVLDIEDSVSLTTAKLLLRDYTYLMYTTKRHTVAANRFRIILPMSHILKMLKEEYKTFMQNIFTWLPFDVDEGTIDRCRKWESYPGTYEYNEGKLFDALPFIPKTTKNSKRKKFIADTRSLSNMERWFCDNTSDGNRSNQLIKYALMLVDAGLDFDAIHEKIMSLNSKLKESISEAEIISTIMQTVSKAISKRTN